MGSVLNAEMEVGRFRRFEFGIECGLRCDECFEQRNGSGLHL